MTKVSAFFLIVFMSMTSSLVIGTIVRTVLESLYVVESNLKHSIVDSN